MILAAGLGTRMRSRTAKELQPLAGRPLIDYVVRAVDAIHPAQIIVVLSPAKAEIAERLPAGCEVAWQEEQLGTGHAAAQALPLLRPSIEHVAILFGDHPLLTGDVVADLVDTAVSSRALITLLTTVLDRPGGYGRLRWEDGRITGVVEAKVDAATYAGPVEVNSGISCYRRDWLERALPAVPRSPIGEYYLTSLVERAAAEPWPVPPVVSVQAPPEAAYGVNDRVELAEAERIVRRRICERLMREGVTIVDPPTTYIDDAVEIGQDSRIEPCTFISGSTTIAEGCRIGPHAIVRDSRIGPECAVVASVVEESEIGARVDVGPYAHLRPGNRIGDDVHIGNYVELKNATIGPHTRIGHVSYLGDAEVGEDVNIGAGAITANYDGVHKHRTVIGDHAFIGVDTMLRAPVTVGRASRTGAGSVVTRDVDPGTTVVGVPARPMKQQRPSGDDQVEKGN